MFKKDDSTSVKNYRPVNELPVVSKVFERIMLNQINSYMDSFLSIHLCGYRKGFSIQTALSSLNEKWKAVLDRKGFSAAIFMDLSKAFDTINHELLLANCMHMVSARVLFKLSSATSLSDGRMLK